MRPVGRVLTIRCDGPFPIERVAAQARYSASGTTILLSTLDELRPYTGSFAALLDPLEQQRMDRYRFEGDRERYLLGHGLLRAVLGKTLDRDPASLELLRGDFGKPYLHGLPIHFNLSDTKDAVAIALSKDHELGVDLETVSRKVDHHAVGVHYFSHAEQADIATSKDAKRRFLDFWTRKEAILKASGIGIMDDLRVLQVHERTNQTTISHGQFIAMAAPQYHVRTWHVGTDHIVSLACAEPFGAVELVHYPYA